MTGFAQKLESSAQNFIERVVAVAAADRQHDVETVIPASNLVKVDAKGVQVHNANVYYVQANHNLADVDPGCKGKAYIYDGQSGGPVTILPLVGATSLVVVKSGTNYTVDPV
jgi:hypothetical protein